MQLTTMSINPTVWLFVSIFDACDRTDRVSRKQNPWPLERSHSTVNLDAFTSVLLIRNVNPLIMSSPTETSFVGITASSRSLDAAAPPAATSEPSSVMLFLSATVIYKRLGVKKA